MPTEIGPPEGSASALNVTGAPGALSGDEITVELDEPPAPKGVVLFAHGNASSRHSPRNRFVAAALREAGFATLLADLLTTEEAKDHENFFDVHLLASRLATARAWLKQHRPALPVGLFGAGTGAAAAVLCAAREPAGYFALVCRGGRLDLTREALEDALGKVPAPTLLLVGGDDIMLLPVNEEASHRLANATLEVIPGAGHLFEEQGMLELVAARAADWFTACVPVPPPPALRR